MLCGVVTTVLLNFFVNVERGRKRERKIRGRETEREETQFS